MSSLVDCVAILHYSMFLFKATVDGNSMELCISLSFAHLSASLFACLDHMLAFQQCRQ